MYSHKNDYKTLDGGSGWIINTMSVVMWAIQNTYTFTDAIIAAVNVRGDTDTNASITGAIAGAIYGFKSIPMHWIDILNQPNKYNIWNNNQVNINYLTDRLASLANC